MYKFFYDVDWIIFYAFHAPAGVEKGMRERGGGSAEKTSS